MYCFLLKLKEHFIYVSQIFKNLGFYTILYAQYQIYLFYICRHSPVFYKFWFTDCTIYQHQQKHQNQWCCVHYEFSLFLKYFYIASVMFLIFFFFCFSHDSFTDSQNMVFFEVAIYFAKKLFFRIVYKR